MGMDTVAMAEAEEMAIKMVESKYIRRPLHAMLIPASNTQAV
jgi:hypothetical protein